MQEEWKTYVPRNICEQELKRRRSIHLDRHTRSEEAGTNARKARLTNGEPITRQIKTQFQGRQEIRLEWRRVRMLTRNNGILKLLSI